MGREVRRVPLDFDWPLNKLWAGFVLPDKLCPRTCPDCAGTGTTSARQCVAAIARLLLMLDDDLNDQARGRPVHPYLRELLSMDRRPSPDIREFGTGLAGRPTGWMGHDAMDQWHATDKIVEAAGLPKEWGYCLTCHGAGSIEEYPGQSDDAEEWQPADPPVGDGWQLWETVSEGSPISPVFLTRDGLVDWIASPAYTPVGASQPMTREQAGRFVDEGWAPSFVFSPATGLVPGEEFAALTASGDEGPAMSVNPNPGGRCWNCHGPLVYKPKPGRYRCRACKTTWDQEDLYFPDGRCGCDNCQAGGGEAGHA